MGNIQNDLIRRARLEPAELTIRDNQVNALIDHLQGCQSPYVPLAPRDEIAAQIRAGKLKFMDIPVRVLGQESR